MAAHKIKKSITTKASSWQIDCWDTAKAKAPFVINDIYDRHVRFLDELATAYGYKLELKDTVAKFVVKEQA